MIVDTDVLVWYLRGNERALKAIEEQPRLRVSAVNYIEMVQGMRNTDELRRLRRTFRGWGVKVLTIDEQISSKAISYVERHFLSHGFHLADALVAATCVVNGLPLLTANTRHYRAIKELELVRFRP
jgi:hypothetical protein